MIGRRDYETRRATRIARLRARASGKRDEAQERLDRDKALLGVMNGTPILVGHHSERRHRRDMERIHNNVRKSIEANDEANRLERAAARAESSESISSDDPEALQKLRDKVTKLETTRERMKQCNAVIRKARSAAIGKGAEQTRAIVDALCKELGWSEATAAKMAEPDCFGNIGFASFELTNRNAEVRRLKQRIALLEAAAARAPREEQTIGDVVLDEAENRVRLRFSGKPAENIRTELKRNGFRWTPSEGVWQRMANDWAWDVAQRIARQAST